MNKSITKNTVTKTVIRTFTAMALALAAVIWAMALQAPEARAWLLETHQTVTPSDGVVAIDLAKVDDGKAHYYQLELHGKEIRFFVILSSDGVVRAAFDACDVCYKSRQGYAQDGRFMICRNCGQRFHASRINLVQGGCNPAPLTRETVDGRVLIPVDAIAAGARFF
jgi:uncharacterized membrane protein